MSEFDEVIRVLREQRPEASELELDGIKRRVRKRAARPSGKGQILKSRLAVLTMLVLGMLLSTTGAGLAVSGLSGPGANAAQETYGDVEEDGDQGGGGEDNEADDEGGVSPGTVGGGEDVAGDDVQPARQQELGAEAGDMAEVDDGELPFTGLAALPILVGGVALLTGGLVLRRRNGA